MSRCAIVYAKAPVAGQAKTRLIPALGAAGAAALAEHLLDRAVAAACSAAFDAIELCASPDTTHPAFDRLARAWPLRLTLQGDGDLGVRMQRTLARVLQRHEHAVLLGTDAPWLDAAVLAHAADALQDHDAAFVPALDGGYVLVGISAGAPASWPALFTDITWSTAAVMAQTRDRARAAGLRWAELPPQPDIDEPADLQHLAGLPGHWPGRPA